MHPGTPTPCGPKEPNVERAEMILKALTAVYGEHLAENFQPAGELLEATRLFIKTQSPMIKSQLLLALIQNLLTDRAGTPDKSGEV